MSINGVHDIPISERLLTLTVAVVINRNLFLQCSFSLHVWAFWMMYWTKMQSVALKVQFTVIMWFY